MDAFLISTVCSPTPPNIITRPGNGSLLHVYVDACVVFEDAKAGVEAAKAAGMYTVGLGPIERVGQADFVLPDLSSVTPHDLLQRLAPTSSGG